MANVAPPKGMTRAESKELNRRRLLNAARELLIECGYGALSARQVSARAGVAQSSFYAHFRDKEDLVQTLADEIFSRLRRQLRESRRGASVTGWEEMLNQTWARLYEFYLAERDLVALLFQELDQPGSPINDIGQEIFETLHRDLNEDLLQLIDEHRIPAMPVDAMTSMVIGTATYILRRLVAGKLENPLTLFQEIGQLNHALLVGLEGKRSAEP